MKRVKPKTLAGENIQPAGVCVCYRMKIKVCLYFNFNNNLNRIILCTVLV